MRHLHVFCEGEKLKATRQAYYGILEGELVEIVSTSEEIKCSRANTAPHLLDFMREYLREGELPPYKVDARKEHSRLENEAILEPRNWQEKQNDFSPSSENLPEEEKIAHRMGLLQQEFPMLCRTGITAADPN